MLTSTRQRGLDHQGIVAGLCNQIGLIERINERVEDTGRKVSVGQAVQAMVLYGLGFVGRPLYLTPEFFANKPADVLISEGVTAEDLNGYSLGRALDRLYESGVGEIVEDKQAVQAALQTKGEFVLATNDPDADRLSAEALVNLYKGQNLTVERGFRFLKDPLFFAHSLFLKKPFRIMALLMVMGLCLLVYALAEHQLRTELVRRNETLPDQRGKPTQRITMRRVFQVFEGIHILTIYDPVRSQRLVLNLTELRYRILDLLGPHVKKRYLLPE